MSTVNPYHSFSLYCTTPLGGWNFAAEKGYLRIYYQGLEKHADRIYRIDSLIFKSLEYIAEHYPHEDQVDRVRFVKRLADYIDQEKAEYERQRFGDSND